MIALVDYGSGNIRSVQKALQAVGAHISLVRDPAELSSATTAMVLPGVGAFDDCISALQRQQLWSAIKAHIDSGKPFLGICVGYQALFERSEEFNSCAVGLEVFGGKVVRFPDEPGLKVPQIGWNQLEIVRPECPLFQGVDEGSHVYFVHSFYPQPADEDVIISQTQYGVRFASAVWRDNVFATQFHPEKSQAVGLRILKNFVDFASERQ